LNARALIISSFHHLQLLLLLCTFVFIPALVANSCCCEIADSIAFPMLKYILAEDWLLIEGIVVLLFLYRQELV